MHRARKGPRPSPSARVRPRGRAQAHSARSRIGLARRAPARTTSHSGRRTRVGDDTRRSKPRTVKRWWIWIAVSGAGDHCARGGRLQSLVGHARHRWRSLTPAADASCAAGAAPAVPPAPTAAPTEPGPPPHRTETAGRDVQPARRRRSHSRSNRPATRAAPADVTAAGHANAAAPTAMRPHRRHGHDARAVAESDIPAAATDDRGSSPRDACSRQHRRRRPPPQSRQRRRRRAAQPPAAQPPPRSTAASPTPPPSTIPPSSPVESDDALIRGVIRTYERAIETKNVDLFRSVRPGLSAAEERSLRDQLQSDRLAAGGHRRRGTSHRRSHGDRPALAPRHDHERRPTPDQREPPDAAVREGRGRLDHH